MNPNIIVDQAEFHSNSSFLTVPVKKGLKRLDFEYTHIEMFFHLSSLLYNNWSWKH